MIVSGDQLFFSEQCATKLLTVKKATRFFIDYNTEKYYKST